MSKIIICVGISGAGKSTWTSQYMLDNPKTIRINRDSMRESMVGSKDYYKRSDLRRLEDMITSINRYIMAEACANNYDIIIDNTNLTPTYFGGLLQFAAVKELEVKVKLFDIGLQEAQNRVIGRDYPEKVKTLGKDLSHSEEVQYIDKQYRQFIGMKKHITDRYEGFIIS